MPAVTIMVIRKRSLNCCDRLVTEFGPGPGGYFGPVDVVRVAIVHDWLTHDALDLRTLSARFVSRGPSAERNEVSETGSTKTVTLTAPQRVTNTPCHRACGGVHAPRRIGPRRRSQ